VHTVIAASHDNIYLYPKLYGACVDFSIYSQLTDITAPERFNMKTMRSRSEQEAT